MCPERGERPERRAANGTKSNDAAEHWAVYILRCADETLYTGVTNDVTRRLAMHENGTGAKYTRGRGPLALIHTEIFSTRGEAQRREAEIKALSRADKLALAGKAFPGDSSPDPVPFASRS